LATSGRRPRTPSFLVHKFTDRSVPKDALWLLVGDKTRCKKMEYKGHHRGPDETVGRCRQASLGTCVRRARAWHSGDCPTTRKESKTWNFLQIAERDPRIVIRGNAQSPPSNDGTVEPGATLRRTRPVDLRFRKPEDRAAIVRHRLFENAESYDRDAAKSLVQSYINAWKKFGIETTPTPYAARMEGTFPFLPEPGRADLYSHHHRDGRVSGNAQCAGVVGAQCLTRVARVQF